MGKRKKKAQRCRQKHSETETCRFRVTRERDRQRDRCCRTEKSRQRPVRSQCVNRAVIAASWWTVRVGR